METKEQKTARRIMETATIRVSVKYACIQHSFCAEDDGAPSQSKVCSFYGSIDHSYIRTQIGDENCEISFHIEEKIDQGATNDEGDSVVGCVNYLPNEPPEDGHGDLFAISIPCKTDYFESVEAVAKQLMNSERGKVRFDVGVIGFPENWRPKAPEPPKPTFWVTFIQMNYCSEDTSGEDGEDEPQ